MSSKRKSIKRKLFLSTSDKDDIQRVRNKEDYELSMAGKYGTFPTYNPEIVLKSFTERDENVNSKFFAKTWEKIKRRCHPISFALNTYNHFQIELCTRTFQNTSQC